MMRVPVAILIAAGLWLPASAFPADLPTLTVKEGEGLRELELVALDVEVDIRGILAETVFELTYRNATTNRLEGEFSLALPAGATISTYALEVAGEMRPAVSVEAEKARNAYETIKRRGIDPGIVERLDGNVYRTRIFPIEPRSTKRVRIGYIVSFADGTFELPLRHDSEIDTFSMSVRGINGAPEFDCLGAPEPKFPGKRTALWEKKRFRPDAILTARNLWTGNDGGPVADVSATGDGTRHFVIQAPAAEPAEAETVREFDLIWDSSRSGSWRNSEKDIAALAALCGSIGDGTVHLQVLGTTISERETFGIEAGEAPALIERLRGIRHDGAANFSLVEPGERPLLLVTDGVASSPSWLPDPDEDWSRVGLLIPPGFLSRAETSIDPAFFAVGARVLVREEEEEWIERWSRPKRDYTIDELDPESWEVVQHGKTFVATGTIPPRTEGVVLRTPDGRSFDVPEKAEIEEWSFARRVRGQQRLAELEARGHPGPIAAFAKQERLASDHTSLIVLEFFRDHVRFRIPPPEPDQLARYHQELLGESNRVRSSMQEGWMRKRKRYEKVFPWFDSTLEAEAATVGVWVDAAKQAFPEEKFNHEEVAPYVTWLGEAEKVLAREGEVRTKDDLQEWTDAIQAQLESLATIRTLPPPPNAPGDRIHVSVRGFVREKGVQSGEGFHSLRKAIGMAGGPNHYGNWSRVYLYRDAARTGYNLESDSYVPVPLQWGDMVVVEREEPRWYTLDGFSDPFADPFVDPHFVPDPGRAPSVFEQAGTKKADIPVAGAGDEGPDVFSNPDGTESSPMGATVALGAPVPPNGTDEALVAEIEKSTDPSATYRTLLEGRYGWDPVSPGTVLALARALSAKGHREAAAACLGNLLEILPNPYEAARAYAYGMAELVDPEKAVEFLAAVAATAPDDATRSLLHYDMGTIAGNGTSFARAAELALASGTDRYGDYPAILTDRFRFRDREEDETPGSEAMPSDIRVVVVSCGDELSLEVDTPAGHGSVEDVGALRTRGDRIVEWQLRRAWPGTYHFRAVRWTAKEPIMAHLRIYTNWARENESVTAKTLFLDANRSELGTIEFQFGE